MASESSALLRIPSIFPFGRCLLSLIRLQIVRLSPKLFIITEELSIIFRKASLCITRRFKSQFRSKRASRALHKAAEESLVMNLED